MLSFTTLRHEIFLTFPRLKAEGTNICGYATVIDGIVDRVADKVEADAELFQSVGSCGKADAACALMLEVMPDFHSEAPWIHDNAVSAILRRVLFVLFPDRFGFERTGWLW